MKKREFLAVAFLGGIAGAGIIGVLVGSQHVIVGALVVLIVGGTIFGVVTHKGGRRVIVNPSQTSPAPNRTGSVTCLVRKGLEMSNFTLSPEDTTIALQVLDEMRRSFRADLTEVFFLRTVAYYLQQPNRKPKSEAEQDVWQAFCRAKAKEGR